MAAPPGEVWLADLGLAAKPRPVIIVSRYDPDLPRAVVIYVPLTTQNRQSAYEVALPKLPFLDRDSVANVQGIGSLPMFDFFGSWAACRMARCNRSRSRYHSRSISIAYPEARGSSPLASPQPAFQCGDHFIMPDQFAPVRLRHAALDRAVEPLFGPPPGRRTRPAAARMRLCIQAGRRQHPPREPRESARNSSSEAPWAMRSAIWRTRSSMTAGDFNSSVLSCVLCGGSTCRRAAARRPRPLTPAHKGRGNGSSRAPR